MDQSTPTMHTARVCNKILIRFRCDCYLLAHSYLDFGQIFCTFYTLLYTLASWRKLGIDIDARNAKRLGMTAETWLDYYSY